MSDSMLTEYRIRCENCKRNFVQKIDMCTEKVQCNYCGHIFELRGAQKVSTTVYYNLK